MPLPRENRSFKRVGSIYVVPRCLDTPLLKRSQVVGTRKNKVRQTVSEFSSERDGGLKILVNSYIKRMDKIELRMNGKSCAAMP